MIGAHRSAQWAPSIPNIANSPPDKSTCDFDCGDACEMRKCAKNENTPTVQEQMQTLIESPHQSSGEQGRRSRQSGRSFGSIHAGRPSDSIRAVAALAG
jgi:hypothetical protein